MRNYILVIIVLLNNPLYSQDEIQNTISPGKRLLIEEKYNNLQEKVDGLEKRIEESNKEIKKDINSYKQDTKDLVNLYVYFITGGILVIGFLINFFGRTAIKKRVEELILEKAQKHIEKKILDTLNSRITNDLIETAIKSKSEDEINKIISSLEQKGISAIDSFKTKGDEVIKSMLVFPPKIQFKIKKKQLSDAEITNKNDLIRVDNFFNLAFSSSDPRIQIELYKNVLKLDPANKHAMNNMAVGYNNLNDPKNAIIHLEKAINIDSNYFQAYANRAQAYNLLDEYKKAFDDADKAIKIESKFEYAYSVKGNILTKLGQHEEAEIVLNKAVEMSPNSPEAHFNLAFFYEEQGEYDKSMENYLKAEELNYPNKAMLYNNIAVVFRRLKEFNKAIEFIDKAKQFNPNYPNIDGTLALIYADQGDDRLFYKNLKIALEKGCPAWNYLSDNGFDKYRKTNKLKTLIEHYKEKY